MKKLLSNVHCVITTYYKFFLFYLYFFPRGWLPVYCDGLLRGWRPIQKDQLSERGTVLRSASKPATTQGSHCANSIQIFGYTDHNTYGLL